MTAVCINEGEHHHDPICTELVKGKRYKVIGIRDADLRPPKDKNKPEEIMIIPGDTAVDKLGWWYQTKYFRLEG